MIEQVLSVSLLAVVWIKCIEDKKHPAPGYLKLLTTYAVVAVALGIVSFGVFQVCPNPNIVDDVVKSFYTFAKRAVVLLFVMRTTQLLSLYQP